MDRFDRLDLEMPFPLWVVRVAEHDGYDSSPSEILERLPSGLVPIGDEDAERVVRDLAIRATPLAIAVQGGMVVAKGYVRGPEDVIEIARPLRALHGFAAVGA